MMNMVSSVLLTLIWKVSNAVLAASPPATQIACGAGNSSVPLMKQTG